MKSIARRTAATTNRALVSVIMPVFNEGLFIDAALRSLQVQSAPDFHLEILVIDGMSEDDTRERVAARAAADPRIKLLSNPLRHTPAALNRGLRAARGEYVGIMGAHASYDRDYIAVCLQELLAHDAVGCSGKLTLSPANASAQARLVAWALAHPFASSSRSVRTQPQGYADTVPFPVMKKQVLLDAGGYDERLVRNQDNDMNQRLRALGFKLYLTTKTKCRYYPRPDISSFVKHAFRSGLWNAWSLKTNLASLGLRHLAPLAFVIALLVFAAIGFTGLFAGEYSRPATWAFEAILAGHIGLGTGAAIAASLREQTAVALCLAPLIFVFHCAYGMGTLMGLFFPVPKPRIIQALEPQASSRDCA